MTEPPQISRERCTTRPSPLPWEGTDDSVRAGLQERLAALDRAEQRLEAGTYGFSVPSGLPIPDDRLEADPAAELTAAEARARRLKWPDAGESLREAQLIHLSRSRPTWRCRTP